MRTTTNRCPTTRKHRNERDQGRRFGDGGTLAARVPAGALGRFPPWNTVRRHRNFPGGCLLRLFDATRPWRHGRKDAARLLGDGAASVASQDRPARYPRIDRTQRGTARVRMFNTESTLIAAYGYDPEKQEMDIDFIQGGTYRYFAVPQEAFNDFLRAPSKGKHFLRFIKGVY